MDLNNEFDEDTLTYHSSMKTVSFRYCVLDEERTVLEYKNTYFYAFEYELPETIIPDQATYEFFTTCPKKVVEGVRAYCSLRMLPTIPYSPQSPEYARRTQRPVWCSKSRELNPPETDYVKVVRGKEYPAERKKYWVEMIGMLGSAMQAAKDKPVEWLKLPELDQRYLPMTPAMKYVRPVVKAAPVSIFEQEPEFLDMQGDARVQLLQQVCEAAIVLSQLPVKAKNVYVSPEMVAFKIALRHARKTRKEVPEIQAHCGIYGSFVDTTLKHVISLSLQVIVLKKPVMPSPSGYSKIPAYRGRIHVKGFAVQLFHIWEYIASPVVDLYVDCLRPGEVYAANSSRARTYIRTIRNMGYQNAATALESYVERDYIRHTYDAVQLVDHTIWRGYTSYIDLNTGKRFRLHELGLDFHRRNKKLEVNLGTVLYTKCDLQGNVHPITVRNGKDTETGWLVMKNARLKLVYTDEYGVEQLRHMIVSVV